MDVLWRLLGYLRPYLARLVVASLMLGVSGALMAVVVATVKPLVNDVLTPAAAAVSTAAPAPTPADPAGADAATAPRPPADVLDVVKDVVPLDSLGEWARDRAFVQVPLLLVALFVVRGVFLYFGRFETIRVGASVIRDVRTDLYESVARQSVAFFQIHSTGVIMSRIVNDVQRMQQASTSLLSDLVRILAMVPGLLLTAFLHDWRMSLAALVTLPLLGVPMVRLGKRLRRAARASLTSMGVVADRIAESVGAVKIVQGFGMERYEVGRFRAAVDTMLRADLRAGRASALSPAVLELIGAVIGAGMFMSAGYFIAHGRLDPGDFAVVLVCLGLLFVSIRRLNTLYNEFQHSLAAGARVFEMMDRQREIRDAADAVALPRFEREIAFDRVRFGYGDDDVLRDLELTIRAGETVALVGSSGAGKSTLANLVPRFYDPTDGALRIDGHDLRGVTLASLRAQIGLVTQETLLFDDTVRNNIAYGRSDIPLERVVEVARLTRCHEFVERMPAGYDTMLGERGARISMGQRQRITIARALLKDPPILILDEATSALDAESEALVQQALEVLMRGRTSIVIAHRLATVRNADRIVVLDAGCVVEQGTHRELLARGGVYARLYELQFAEADA